MIYELIRNNYPQIIGQVLVLNYQWMHSGIWGLISSMLSIDAKSRLAFVTEEQMQEYIPLENIPARN